MTAKPLYLALRLEDFQKLVRGEVVTVVTTPNYQPVRMILSDIGFTQMEEAINAARKARRP